MAKLGVGARSTPNTTRRTTVKRTTAGAVACLTLAAAALTGCASGADDADAPWATWDVRKHAVNTEALVMGTLLERDGCVYVENPNGSVVVAAFPKGKAKRDGSSIDFGGSKVELNKSFERGGLVVDLEKAKTFEVTIPAKCTGHQGIALITK